MSIDGGSMADIGGDVREWLPPMPQPQVPQAPAAAPAGPAGPAAPAPGAGILPPGYGTNPQDVMRMIMQMMLSQQLGNFFNPNARGPSQFTPGTAFAPPAPPGVPGPNAPVGPLPPPSIPWQLPGLLQPGMGQFPTQGPRMPGSDPNLAYASGGGGMIGPSMSGPLSSNVGNLLNPGDTSGLAPSANWDLRGRMGMMIPEMQGPEGGMNSPYAFISEILRQMAQGGWPTNA